MDGGAYVAFDVLESLKNFRDTRKCLDGLNKLRTALKSGDGLRVLGQLAEASPNLEELIIIWDHQNKVGTLERRTIKDCIYTTLHSKKENKIPLIILPPPAPTIFFPKTTPHITGSRVLCSNHIDAHTG